MGDLSPLLEWPSEDGASSFSLVSSSSMSSDACPRVGAEAVYESSRLKACRNREAILRKEGGGREGREEVKV